MYWNTIAGRLRLSAVCSFVVLAMLAQPVAAQKKLEEVIVTAQKREQSLQDVSVPVTAISFDRIETNQITNLEDLQQLTPSFSFGNSLGFAKIFIRGVGLNDQTAGIDPSVALHVDGAVINDPTAHFTSLFDLERVEVLRGPQGILYGRNATGGSINLITAKPTRELEGYGRVSYGNYERMLAEGAVSGPLNGWLSGRAAFRMLSRDGYGENEVTGNDVDDAEQQAMRVHLQADFNNDVSWLLTGEYYMEDDHSLGSKFKRATFPQFRTDPTLTPAEAASIAPLGLGGYPDGTRNYASEYDPQNDKTTWAVTSTWDIRLSDRFSIKNITNYREVDGFFTHDFDASAVINRYDVTGQPPSIHSRAIYSNQFTNEFQIHYTDDRVTGLFAIYHFKQHMKVSNRSGLTPFSGLPVPGLNRPRVYLTGQGEADSWSVFSNITYNINRQFALKLGARYTSEDRTINNVNFIRVFQNPAGVVNPLSAIPNFPIVASFSDQRSTDDFSPMVGLEWRPMDNLMAYYTFSEGFKSAVGQLGQTDNEIVEPERIENHEFGIKSSWLDNAVNLNVAAFFYDMENLQLARTLPEGGGGSGFVNRFENAAAVDGAGVEVEVDWQVTDQLNVSGALSWLDVEFSEYNTVDNFDPCLVLASCTPPVQSFAGNTPRNTPEWAYTVHGEYLYPLPNGATLTFGADVSYKGKQYFSEFNNEVESSGAFTFVDATLTYRSVDNDWYLTAWGKNLADERTEAGSFTVSLSRTVGRTYLPPRTYGITAGYNF